jgi:hypothetical protein
MFIYLGLIAAMVLAGPPDERAAPGAEATRNSLVIADSPLLRRDI